MISQASFPWKTFVQLLVFILGRQIREIVVAQDLSQAAKREIRKFDLGFHLAMKNGWTI